MCLNKNSTISKNMIELQMFNMYKKWQKVS